MLPDDPHAQGRRRAVLVVTGLVVLVFGLLATKLVTMQLTQALGERAWRSGDAVAAERHFAAGGRWNVVQRWIAPFNRGVVSYGQREWDGAARWFEQSFAMAPTSARCKVALNWTWSLEAAGDELSAGGLDTEAAQRWSLAESVLAQAVGCDDGSSSRQPEPTPEPQATESEEASAESSDESDETATSEQDQRDATQQRIEEKKSGNRAEEPPEDEDPSPQDKAEQLAERNSEAAKIQQKDNEEPGERSSDGPRRTW